MPLSINPELRTHDDLRAWVREHPKALVYLSTGTCETANAVRPMVLELFEGGDWDMVEVDTNLSPDIGGQLLVFTHPTILLFGDGREFKRFSRHIVRRDVQQSRDRLNALMAPEE